MSRIARKTRRATINGESLGLPEMKGRLLMWLVVALIANGASLTVHAQSVTTLDPSFFAPGTNVSNAFAGLTLSAMTLVPDGTTSSGAPIFNATYAPVYADGDLFSTQPSPASPVYANNWGGQLLGASNLCLQACTPDADTELSVTSLLISFNQPVDMVTALQIDNPMNGMEMQAFNSSNQLVGYCFAADGSVEPQGNYGCYTVLSKCGDSVTCETALSVTTPYISKVLVGGFDMPDEIGRVQVSVSAPEIDPASAASGLTLLLGALLVLLGRRPKASSIPITV
jgi:hypothetical protein